PRSTSTRSPTRARSTSTRCLPRARSWRTTSTPIRRRRMCWWRNDSPESVGEDAVEQRDQPVALGRPAQLLDQPLLMRRPDRDHLLDEARALRRQVQRVRPLVALRLAPLGQPPPLQPVHQRDEIGALDAELLGDLGLLLA